MEASAARYGEWKAPAEDGQMLIWPEPDQLRRDTLDNAKRLATSSSVKIQNLPLPELRRATRGWLGHQDDARPIIATGHQAELYHPGVWVKDALTNALATKLGGEAYHFAVDTDEPKHLVLRWPGGSEPLTDDRTSGVEWAGRLSPPTPAHIKHLSDTFAAASAGWSFRPLVEQFLSSLRRLSLESLDLPSTLTNATHGLDWELGLRHHALVVSPLCHSESYLAFVHHILSRADAFAADYNAALGEYRREHRIRTPGRPMPDLKVSGDVCEVPFWCDSLDDGARGRASVRRAGDQWTLSREGSSGGAFVLDPSADGWEAAGRLAQWLRANQLRLSPRALTLTTVLRLLVADQFVHGIGGGQYDQVTDLLIAGHFGVEPPRFSVTTATLYFPEAVGRSRVCLPCVEQEGHRLRHGILGAEKIRLVEAIAAAPRGSTERSSLFFEMHDRLDAAARHPVLRDWERRLADAQRTGQEERILFDRELFYAIQPAERLGEMISLYKNAFA